MSETPQESPARAVTGMVDHVLELAATWTNCAGKPAHVDDQLDHLPGDSHDPAHSAGR
ncbi:hypothetical protein ACWDBW_08660 [Streptomyces sp. NPDC001107]